LLLWGLVLIVTGFKTPAAELSEAQREFLSGNYSNCVAMSEQGIRERQDREEWQLLLCKAQLATGQYPQALNTISNALIQNRWNIRLRWQAREVYLSNGRTNEAARVPNEIIEMVRQDPRDYREAPSLVVLGQAVLQEGSDPRQVLGSLFDAAKKADPKLRDTYLAAGGLALEKHDSDRAAKEFQLGLDQLPDDPDLLYGLARAYTDSDRQIMAASLETALERNSNHVASLLLLTDHCIDAEDYGQASKLLDRIKEVNPWHPDAWCYRAVLAHLQNQPAAEAAARLSGLKYWPTNPRVDHLIGTKLSQKYRFTEGAEHQRQALKFAPDYLPAKAQLAQDLLRLGEETEGWRLAQEVQQQDGYDVEAYNLANLHDTMGKFVTLMNRDFRVRMSKSEAALYGAQVLELLSQAKSNLCAKYGFEIRTPAIVEIFPAQKDFAVRTFGMPGNPGYLGVCFGSLITANSPASQTATPVNWQSVLWHEFCHVVTLQMTRNKMPRWLSEGISVYEERQANPAWGEHLNPSYREMILGDGLTPISKLSGAFLTPQSPLHLQFAYYESSLVVEFIIQQFGLDRVKAILRDLGEGQEINQTIEKHTAPMARLEKDFTAYARAQAVKLGPGLNWEKPDFLAANNRQRGGNRRGGPADDHSSTNLPPVLLQIPGALDAAWEAWEEKHPTNYWVMTRKAMRLVEAKEWSEARPLLRQLVELHPGDTGPESAYRLLAAAHRALGETNLERQVLTRFAEKDDAAADAYLRLMELGAAAKDWAAVVQNAERFLAVNPLVAPPYRFLARAAEQTGANQTAIEANRALLELDPSDPAEVHFQLARALYRAKETEARRQVLMALEEAPRYREALQLLLKINEEMPPPKPAAVAPAPPNLP
jgi:tetratricopeptide (TPR) repeat protein